MESGGLKFHCCRTISFTELPPSGDQRKTNSCVSGNFIFLKDKRYALEPLRLIEDQANRLAPRRCCTPTPRISRNKRGLDRAIFVFRRDFHDGCTLDIQPTFCASPNTFRSWGDEPFSHISSLLFVRRFALDPTFQASRRFGCLWQAMTMARTKLNFRRTTIARAKAAIKKHRAAKKKKALSMRGTIPIQSEGHVSWKIHHSP